jgi:hypothetical protein
METAMCMMESGEITRKMAKGNIPIREYYHHNQIFFFDMLPLPRVFCYV